MAEEAAKKVSPLEVDPDKDVSYINMTLLDASKTIETTVKDKLGGSVGNIRFPMVKRFLSKESVQNKIAVVASKRVKPSMVAKGLADQMPKLLMYMIHQKIGMTLAAKTVFVEDAYLVIEFQVKKVDTQKLLAKIQEGIPEDGGMDDEDLEVPPEVMEAWMKEMEQDTIDVTTKEAAPEEGPQPERSSSSSSWSWSGWIAAQSEYVITQLLPENTKKGLEQDTMPPLVQTKITEEMGTLMAKKLAEKQLETEIAVLSSDTQARYFYSNLAAVRDRQKK